MSPLSTYLRTRRFNRPTFGLTRHTNLWKNTAFRDFSNIWRGRIFFLLTFWLLHLLSTDLITLLLLFNSPYCRKFLFKLPSMMICNLCTSKIHLILSIIILWSLLMLCLYLLSILIIQYCFTNQPISCCFPSTSCSWNSTRGNKVSLVWMSDALFRQKEKRVEEKIGMGAL